MILTVDYTEIERRVLAHYFQAEPETFERLGTVAGRIVEGIMIEKDATGQAAEAKIAAGGDTYARAAENAATGLASRVERPVGKRPELGVPYGRDGLEPPKGTVPRVPRVPED